MYAALYSSIRFTDGTWTADGSLLLMLWGHWKVFEL